MAGGQVKAALLGLELQREHASACQSAVAAAAAEEEVDDLEDDLDEEGAEDCDDEATFLMEAHTSAALASLASVRGRWPAPDALHLVAAALEA